MKAWNASHSSPRSCFAEGDDLIEEDEAGRRCRKIVVELFGSRIGPIGFRLRDVVDRIPAAAEETEPAFALLFASSSRPSARWQFTVDQLPPSGAIRGVPVEDPPSATSPKP